MKIDPRQAPAFLRAPGAIRAILLHGEDEGQIRERAQALIRLVAGSLDDPFRAADLDRDAWPQLAAETAALSMTGGRRAIRIRDATDAIVTALQAALKTPGDALIVLEAPSLGRGRLRTFVEGCADAAAIACYPEEGRAVTDLIRATLAEHRITTDTETTTWLAETLAGDRAMLRGELEKLVLLAGPGGTLDIEQARSCTGDAAGASADEALLAATNGRIARADTAIEAAMADGLGAIALLRTALSHLQKLHQARLAMQAGATAAEAVRAMRPPVFFRATAETTAAVSLWPADALLRLMDDARATELACKQTGARQELLARRFVSGIARQGEARRRARG